MAKRKGIRVAKHQTIESLAEQLSDFPPGVYGVFFVKPNPPRPVEWVALDLHVLQDAMNQIVMDIEDKKTD